MKPNTIACKLPRAKSSQFSVGQKVVCLTLLGSMVAASMAQDYSILHSFPGGVHPHAVTLSGTTLYGTALPDAQGGQLFKMNSDGSDFTVLKRFTAPYSDGNYPYSHLLLAGTTLYGTTTGGGNHGNGTVFKVSTDGSDFAVIHHFDGTNGAGPSGALALSGETLFGTTRYTAGGLSTRRGTVFKVNTNGSGFEVLRYFSSIAPDGVHPEGGVVLSGSTLYGTTTMDYAGDRYAGSVFKINTDGSGYVVLRHLTGDSDGGRPTFLVISGTTLYGATPNGGLFGSGTVFKLNTDGSGFTVLKHFHGGPAEGQSPGNLVLSGTRLYGATTRGGSYNQGTLFLLNTDGSGYELLKDFAVFPISNGIYPTLYAVSGMMVYGTTDNYRGKVFSLTLSAPAVLASPQSQTAEVGSLVVLTVIAAGVPSPALNWYFDSTNALADCTNSNLVLTNVQSWHGGAFTVVVTNAFGSVTSSPAVLGVIPAIERRTAVAIRLQGETGALLDVDYADSIEPAAPWLPLTTVSLTSASEFCFDTTGLLPPKRFYRARQNGASSVGPTLDLHLVPAITLAGTIGSALQVQGINQFGPIDAWFPLDTVTLTNANQVYFDTSVIGQPPRLYRLMPMP